MESSILNISNNLDTESKDICSICLGPFDNVTGVVYTNSENPDPVCSHEFCQVCLVNWLKHSLSCPLCRKSTIFQINTD